MLWLKVLPVEKFDKMPMKLLEKLKLIEKEQNKKYKDYSKEKDELQKQTKFTYEGIKVEIGHDIDTLKGAIRIRNTAFGQIPIEHWEAIKNKIDEIVNIEVE